MRVVAGSVSESGVLCRQHPALPETIGAFQDQVLGDAKTEPKRQERSEEVVEKEASDKAVEVDAAHKGVSSSR